MARCTTFVVVALCAMAAPAAIATQRIPFRGNDAKALRIVQRDWCDLGRYDRARRLRRLSIEVRRNLAEARQVASARPWGCKIARDGAHADHERVFTNRAPWVHAACPRGPVLPLRIGDRTAAVRAAAAAEPASLRPVIWGTDDPDRRGPVRRCGKRILARTVIVSLSLTGYLPSASLSQRVVAISHFRRYGWRTWLLLH
jgi:hypothetical protein